jgi:hypothetical protein
MANLRMQRRRGSRSEGGASLVEFALVLPLLTVLLFGLFTGGLTFSRQNSVKNAVREATRFGAILPDFPESGDVNPAGLAELYGQVLVGASGDMRAGTEGRVICVAMINESDDWWWEIYEEAGTLHDSGDEEDVTVVDPRCTSDFNPSVGSGTSRIWVSATRQSEIDAIFYQFPVKLDSFSMSRYER